MIHERPTTPAKKRLDQTPRRSKTGIHPLPPGAFVTAARMGTQGASHQHEAEATFSCPAFYARTFRE